MIRDSIFRWSARMFVPHIAAQMERDGALRLSADTDGELREEDYLHIDDHGFDTTIFCFSGMAVLFAGMPQFEFRRIVRRHNKNCNLVFIRDRARTGYHVAPDGKGDGLAFYSAKVREVADRLGSKYNVTLGASGGGTIALYTAIQCGFDHAVTFSPAILPPAYISLGSLASTFFDVRRLFTDFSSYKEIAIVTIGGGYIYRKVMRSGYTPTDIHDLYLKAGDGARPRVSLFFGKNCRPDALQADVMGRLPEVKIIPLDTSHHDCPAWLREHKTLGTSIRDEVQEGIRAAGAGNPRE